MRRTARWVAILAATGMIMAIPAGLRADDDDDVTNKLPAGPIRDRHVLMHEIGDQAENINDAFNVGSEGFDTSIVQRAVFESQAALTTLWRKRMWRSMPASFAVSVM